MLEYLCILYKGFAVDTLFKQKIKVLASQTNFDAKVGLIEALEYFQDNMCEYFKTLNCDGVYLVPKRHAFWAVTKTKVRFNSDVCWLDNFEIFSNVSKMSMIRLDLSQKIVMGENNSIDCLQEMCVMDSDTRKLRTIDSVPEFPKDATTIEPYNDLCFEKFNFNYDEMKLKKSVVVDSNNVDFFGHTNNVEYAKMMYGACSCEFLRSIKIETFEIHHIKESREFDKLDIYVNQAENEINFGIKNGDAIIAEARMVYHKVQ